MLHYCSKKRECQPAFLGAQAPEAFTVLMTSARLVLSRSRSMAFSADTKIVSSAARMQWPTGHAALGFREGVAKGSTSSTARYTSAKLMRPGARLSREPDPAPLHVSTSLARCKDSSSRRTMTGLVLTLPARKADVTRSPSL